MTHRLVYLVKFLIIFVTTLLLSNPGGLSSALSLMLAHTARKVKRSSDGASGCARTTGTRAGPCSYQREDDQMAAEGVLVRHLDSIDRVGRVTTVCVGNIRILGERKESTVRPGSVKAIRQLQRAGITVRIITGESRTPTGSEESGGDHETEVRHSHYTRSFQRKTSRR